jgi:uncharacterized protein
VLVAPTTSQQSGLAAAVSLTPERSVEENARVLSEALSRIRTGSVAPAAREDAQGRFKPGDAVGFVEEDLIAWGDARETLRAVVRALAGPGPGGERPELLSILSGEGAPLPLSELDGMLDSDIELELELRHGGQPAYWWLLTSE